MFPKVFKLCAYIFAYVVALNSSIIKKWGIVSHAAHNLYHCMIYLLQFTRMEENR